MNQRRVVFSKVCSVLCCLLCASVVCEGISFDFAAFCFRCPPLPSPPRPPRAPHSSPPVLAPPRRRARAGGSPGANLPLKLSFQQPATSGSNAARASQRKARQGSRVRPSTEQSRAPSRANAPPLTPASSTPHRPLAGWADEAFSGLCLRHGG